MNTLDEATAALSYCKMRIRQLDGLTQNWKDEEELKALKREYKRLKKEVNNFQIPMFDMKIYR